MKLFIGRKGPPLLFPYIFTRFYSTLLPEAHGQHIRLTEHPSSLGFHHPGNARAALWNLISTTQKYHYRLHGSWRSSLASWKIGSDTYCAVCDAALAVQRTGLTMLDIRFSMCVWLSARQKPTLKADFDRKALIKARRRERGKGRAPVHTGGVVKL